MTGADELDRLLEQLDHAASVDQWCGFAKQVFVDERATVRPGRYARTPDTEGGIVSTDPDLDRLAAKFDDLYARLARVRLLLDGNQGGDQEAKQRRAQFRVIRGGQS